VVVFPYQFFTFDLGIAVRPAAQAIGSCFGGRVIRVSVYIGGADVDKFVNRCPLLPDFAAYPVLIMRV
jgi:hypothetical protein